MAVLAIELPENVLDALAERVAARVLERLENGQEGDRWLDAKQAADYLGLSICVAQAHGRPAASRRAGSSRPQALVPAFAARPLAFWRRQRRVRFQNASTELAVGNRLRLPQQRNPV
jgi:hypothetical protein